MRHFLSVPLLLLTCLFCGAASYYVSTSGNDTNSGTLSNPWRTGSPSSTNTIPGDTVYFRGGTYTNLILNGTGTSNAPVTFAAYPNEKPSIVADNTDTSSVYGIDFSGGFAVLDGFTVHGGIEGIRMIFSPNCIIQNCDVSGTFGGGIAVGYFSSNAIVRNCRVWNADIGNVPRSPNGHGHGWGNGIGIAQGSDHSLIENCIAYLVNGECLVAAGHDCTIQNCIVADCYKTAFYVDGSNNKVLNNICWQTYSNAVLNAPVYGQPTFTIGFNVTTEGQELYPTNYQTWGLRGTAIINNVSINGGLEQDFYAAPTNYLMSEMLYANNTLVNADFALSGGATSPLGGNYHVINNLVFYLVLGGGPVVTYPTNTMDWGNNVRVFDGGKTSFSLSWNGTNGYYFFGFLTNWMAYSGESNSVWIADTNSADLIIPALAGKVSAMPRLWGTNGTNICAPPDMDISWVFTNLATCSNNIVALRNQLAAPFRPINTYNAGRSFPSWTWVDGFGVTNTMTSPLASDMLGTIHTGTMTVGALDAAHTTLNVINLNISGSITHP